MALKKCKECGKELGSKVAKCTECGTDQRNWFMRHKILTVIGAIVVFGIVASLGGEDDQATTSDPDATEVASSSEVDEIESEEEVDDGAAKYGNGTYLVGKDIESGLYKATLTDTFTKMGYIERSKDLNMELDSILANIMLTGDGYVDIKDTDVAVKLQGVEISPVDLKTLEKDIKSEVEGGIYLVGYDIEPGRYKVEVTDDISKMGYVERAKNVSMGLNDIIANEIFQGPGYVDVKKSDFAIRVQGAKLTLQ